MSVYRKIWYLFAIATIVFGVIFVLNQKSSMEMVCAHSQSDGIVVHISEEGFDPKSIDITTGTKVIFENVGFSDVWPASDDHPTHENYSDLDPRKPLIPGQSWGFEFTEKGEYGMHDHLFPSNLSLINVTGESVDKSCHSQLDKEQNLSNNLLTQYSPPTMPEIDAKEMVENIESACQTQDNNCVEEKIKIAIEESGPSNVLSVYTNLTDSGFITIEGDGHQFAHRVGRHTALTFGVNYEAFDSCSTEYNYGCQHGYFEWVLGRTQTSNEAMTLICESISDDKPARAKFYCYHGAGHGVMMSQANDIYASLEICDSLEYFLAQEGCWQGAFMENLNAAFRGEARDNVFSETDHLAPCNQLQDKYQYQCYQHQGPWLVDSIGLSIADSADTCIKASIESSVESCLISLGQMASNVSRMESILQEQYSEDIGQNVVKICDFFPVIHKGVCYKAAIANLSNFDQLNTANSQVVCNAIKQEYRSDCYVQIIAGLKDNAANEDEFKASCLTIVHDWQHLCSSANDL